MSWELLLGMYVVGTIATGVVLYLATHMGIRWQRELPKIPIHESITVLEQRLAEREAELEELQELLFEAKSTIQLAEQKRDWLDRNADHIRDLERKADELHAVEEKLASTIEERDRVVDGIRDLELRRAQIKEQLKGAEDILARIDELREKRERLTGDVAATDRELSRVRLELTQRQADLDKQVARVEELRKTEAEVLKASARLKADVEQMKNERDHLQRQVEGLTKTLKDNRPAEQATLDERTEALWKPPVIQPLSRMSDSKLDEASAVSAAMDVIRKSGLVFHDRSVLAFHTALKVARETPMLVLAGISGTGKSALPRRYAQAMGIHFQNVAVQPGWDSPLDLIGFYNHLEGRFKPTELTRALVQMDSVGSRGGERWPTSSEGDHGREDLSDQMLLVLLDEMNLARVEYYFSEFLSRLEIRRDIDPNDGRDRRQAELSLEIGRGTGDDTQSLPLFVGENVLFVGTMNEDESTQALSDKVVDRSNVMRFGKPSTLREADVTEAFQSPASLAFATWRRWRDATPALIGDERGRVEAFIRECNDLLDGVGRPFAHRTAKTMREYVRQYPNFPELAHTRLKTALSDQLEMQVLPRLRGVDLDIGHGRTSLDRVSSMASRLGDSELAQAVRDAVSRSSDQFLWTGVDRRVDLLQE